MRNVFTVGVKRSVVPALFPEIEMRSQKLYDQDVGKASGLNVLYDVTYVFYSNVTQIPVHRRDRGWASEVAKPGQFNDRFRNGSSSAQPAQPALDSG